MDDVNPFKAPEAAIGPPGGFGDVEGSMAWCEDGRLVMLKGASLPDLCIRCGEPALGYRLKRDLSWHPWGYYILFFMYCLPYIIVVFFVRRTAVIHVGLCPRHRAVFHRDQGIVFVSGFGAIALFILTIAADAYGRQSPALIIFTILLLLFCFFYGFASSRIASPVRITDRCVWLKKVSPRLLALLPARPTPAGNACVPHGEKDELDHFDDYVP